MLKTAMTNAGIEKSQIRLGESPLLLMSKILLILLAKKLFKCISGI